MTDRLLCSFAFAMLARLPGALICKVLRVDLALVLVATLLMAGRDLSGIQKK